MRVVVVGSGAAGAAAAVGARTAGAEPLIVHGPPGATMLAAGAWDVAADVKGVPGDRAVFRPTIIEALRNLARARPHHPYARLGAENVQMAHEAFLAKLGLYPSIEWDAPLALVATDLGFVRETATAQAIVLRIDAVPPGSHVAVVELAGYREMDAQHVAASLTDWSRSAEADLTFAPLEVDFLTRRSDALLHPHEIARVVDTPEGFARLVSVLQTAHQSHPFAAALFPGVLGLGAVFQRAARLREQVGVPVGEMLSGPGAPQGLRLATSIDLALEGIARRGARVQSVVTDRRRARGVVVEGGETIAADAVVLCTGRFLGGGLCKHGRIRESIVGLPLYLDGRPLDQDAAPYGPDPSFLFAEELLGRHAALRVGVGWDDRLRPLASDGAVACENLFAAGDLLEGHDPAADLSGLGVAITTGFLAGRAAAIAARRAVEGA